MKDRIFKILVVAVVALLFAGGCKNPFPGDSGNYEVSADKQGDATTIMIGFDVSQDADTLSVVNSVKYSGWKVDHYAIVYPKSGSGAGYIPADCGESDAVTHRYLCKFSMKVSESDAQKGMDVVLKSSLAASEPEVCDGLEDGDYPCEYTSPKIEVSSDLLVGPASTDSDMSSGGEGSEYATADTTDSDGDGVYDDDDNCPSNYNPQQEDTDGDGFGDWCDNCMFKANPGQEDSNDDGRGDACMIDSDEDGIPDDSDNCPRIYNPDQANEDGDFRGDACDVTLSQNDPEEDVGDKIYTQNYDDGCSLIPGSNANMGSLLAMLFMMASVLIIADRKRGQLS